MKLLCCLMITFPKPWSMKLTELNEKLCEPWEYKGNLMKQGPPILGSLEVFTKLHLSPEVQQYHALLYCTTIIVQQKPTERIIYEVCN